MDGLTPLAVAAKCGRDDMVRTLLVGAGGSPGGGLIERPIFNMYIILGGVETPYILVVATSANMPKYTHHNVVSHFGRKKHPRNKQKYKHETTPKS